MTASPERCLFGGVNFGLIGRADLCAIIVRLSALHGFGAGRLIVTRQFRIGADMAVVLLGKGRRHRKGQYCNQSEEKKARRDGRRKTGAAVRFPDGRAFELGCGVRK